MNKNDSIEKYANDLVGNNEEEIDQINDSQPLVSFGILTDVQYADADDGLSYDKLKKRYYRNSENLVKEAVNDWKLKLDEMKIKFILQLGDFLDAKASGESKEKRDEALEKMLDLFSSIPVNLYHIWGNHEMYNYLRKDLLDSKMNTSKLIPDSNSTTTTNKPGNYYVIDVSENLKIICLDFYEFSILGYEESDVVRKQAHDLLVKHNQNSDLNDPTGLRGHAKRFTAFNGGLSDGQLDWLKNQLDLIKQENKKCIICGHVPLHPQAVSTTLCLAWNQKEVLDLFGNYEKTILAYFSGHDHDGGYFRDKNNIHHITFKAILETPPNTNAYALVKVFKNRVSVEGVGQIGYYEIYF